MQKTILIITMSVLLVGITLGGYLFFKQESQTGPDPVEAIPATASSVILIKDAGGLYQTLTRETTFWDSLAIHTDLSSAATMLQELNSMLENLKAEGWDHSTPPLYFSFHRQGDTQAKWLLSCSFGKSKTLLEALDLLRQKAGNTYTWNKIPTEGETIFEIQHTKKSEKLYACAAGPLLLVSRHAHLIEAGLRALTQKNGLSKQSSFMTLRSTALDKADASFFMSLNEGRYWMNRWLNDSTGELGSFVPTTQGWLEADLDLHTETFRLFGFMLPDSGQTTPYPNIQGLDNGYPRFAEVLPSQTLCYVTLQGETPSGSSEWEGGMLGRASVLTGDHPAWISFWQTDDTEAALQSLSDASAPYLYKGIYPIHRLRSDSLPEILKTYAMGQSKWKFASAMNDYVLLAEDSSSLAFVFDQYEADNTLHRNLPYNHFLENLSPSQALTLFIHLPGLTQWLPAYTRKDFTDDIRENEGLLQSFDAVALQINPEKEKVYFNLTGKYHPYREEERSRPVAHVDARQVELDAPVAAGPFICKNHYDGSREVIVQDVQNQLYLINARGEILWKKSLPERILGEVEQVDRFRNGKLQMMFNTRTQIFQIDRNGKDVKPFPMTLNVPASTGISVFDYDNKRDYRILIPGETGTLSNIDIEGKLTKGWDFQNAGNTFNHPADHFTLGRKDFITIIDAEGKVFFLNRKGEPRFTLPNETRVSVRNPLFYDAGQKCMISTDSTGNVIRIRDDGSTEITSLPPATSQHRTSITDITGDGLCEFLIMDKQKLLTYSHTGDLLFEFTFDHPIDEAPSVFSFSNTIKKIGLADNKGSKIYLFNPNGSVVPGFPLTGQGAFRIQDLDRDGSFELITKGTDNKLFIYTLPQNAVN
ncbi:MAG: hypothetical protein H6585_00940 [Flavobacteriales bacterium]|nr:hypothetical protein [Flavobacteriales bacterium]MCB9446892.1 hypothetical protein [Flavobacteriales bacterium]